MGDELPGFQGKFKISGGLGSPPLGGPGHGRLIKGLLDFHHWETFIVLDPGFGKTATADSQTHVLSPSIWVQIQNRPLTSTSV